jgi:hypothetical protein
METMGEKLAKIEANKAQQSELDARHFADMETAERTKKETFGADFGRWMQDIASSLNAGREPPMLRVERWIIDREGFPISNPKHRDNDLFVDAERWANTNGLNIKVNYDPVGPDTSAKLQVVVRAEAPST